MAEFSIHDFKRTISKKATEVNVKTSMFLEINKIRSYISVVQQEMDKKYTGLGKTVYQMWQEDAVELEKVEALFLELKECEKKIDEYNFQIQKIEEDNKKYMGIANEKVIFCSNCGAKNSSEAAFCRECGSKME